MVVISVYLEENLHLNKSATLNVNNVGIYCL